MIYLNGFGYYVDKNHYADKPDTFATHSRALTGDLLVVKSNVYQQSYSFTLNVSQPDYELLKAAFVAYHGGTAFLDFIDERGVEWDPAAGTDTTSHIHSTGVAFVKLGEAKPATEALFDLKSNAYFSPYRRFTCDIQLIANSKVLN